MSELFRKLMGVYTERSSATQKVIFWLGAIMLFAVFNVLGVYISDKKETAENYEKWAAYNLEVILQQSALSSPYTKCINPKDCDTDFRNNLTYAENAVHSMDRTLEEHTGAYMGRVYVIAQIACLAGEAATALLIIAGILHVTVRRARKAGTKKKKPEGAEAAAEGAPEENEKEFFSWIADMLKEGSSGAAALPLVAAMSAGGFMYMSAPPQIARESRPPAASAPRVPLDEPVTNYKPIVTNPTSSVVASQVIATNLKQNEEKPKKASADKGRASTPATDEKSKKAHDDVSTRQALADLQRQVDDLRNRVGQDSAGLSSLVTATAEVNAAASRVVNTVEKLSEDTAMVKDMVINLNQAQLASSDGYKHNHHYSSQMCRGLAEHRNQGDKQLKKFLHSLNIPLSGGQDPGTVADTILINFCTLDTTRNGAVAAK